MVGKWFSPHDVENPLKKTKRKKKKESWLILLARYVENQRTYHMCIVYILIVEGYFPFLFLSLVLSFSLCGSCFAHFLLHTLSRVYTSTGVRRLAYEKSQRRFVDDCKAWMNMISRLYNHLVNGGSAAFAWQTFWSKSTTNSRSLSFRLFSFGFFFLYIFI